MKPKRKFNARYALTNPGRTALRLAKVGSSAFQTRLRHPGHVEQLIERCVRALQLPQLNDARGYGASDPRDARELACRRRIDVDTAGRRGSNAVPARSVRRSARMARLARPRHVDFVAVLRVCREIDAGGIGGWDESAGQRDCLRVPSAGVEVIEAGPGYRACHVNDGIVIGDTIGAMATRPFKTHCGC